MGKLNERKKTKTRNFLSLHNRWDSTCFAYCALKKRLFNLGSLTVLKQKKPFIIFKKKLRPS